VKLIKLKLDNIMAENNSKRQLLIIGGAEDREGDCQILREFIRRAGGVKANIVARYDDC
jgi:cyanophycinase